MNTLSLTYRSHYLTLFLTKLLTPPSLINYLDINIDSAIQQVNKRAVIHLREMLKLILEDGVQKGHVWGVNYDVQDWGHDHNGLTGGQMVRVLVDYFQGQEFKGLNYYFTPLFCLLLVLFWYLEQQHIIKGLCE